MKNIWNIYIANLYKNISYITTRDITIHSPLKERNVLVAPHDKSQDASRIRTDMANLALIPLVTLQPPTANGPSTPALSACGSIPF